MQQEITISKTREGQPEPTNTVTLEPSMSGEENTRQVWLTNTTKYYMNVSVEVTGDHVELVESPDIILPEATEPVTIKITPPVTLLQPVRAGIHVQADYTIQ